MIRAGWNLITRKAVVGIFIAFWSFAAIAFPNIEGIQVYQKNPHLAEARKKSVASDLYRYHNADNMWDVLRSEFTLPHFENVPEVQAQIDFLMHNQDFLLHCAQRAAPYLYYISQQAKKRHLPAEVVLLPMIESAYNPFAYSSAGAGGIWQIMPSTASGFGIKQNWWYDGRRDVVASTRAALNYLVYLGGFFDGNWLLALAAYNTGEGNVLAAIRRNISDGRSTDFWSLPLSQQTRDYVPRLLALATIIANPDQYQIDFPPVRNAPYLAQVDVGGQVDLNHAAYLAGLNYQALKQLNPGFNHIITGPSGPYKLILPIQNVEQFTENLMRSPLYERTQQKIYRVKSGDTLFAIAKKFKTTPASIRKANTLASNKLRPGSNINIPQLAPAISQAILDSEKQQVTISSKKYLSDAAPYIHGHYSLQPGDTLYMVRHGDDIQKVATKFHMSVKSLLTANNFKQIYALPVGLKLIIPTHFAKANPIQKYQLVPGDTVYVVRANDTIEKIAKKFHTTSPSIRIANLLSSNAIQEGDRLIIPTHG